MYFHKSSRSRRARDRNRGRSVSSGWLIVGGVLAAAGAAWLAKDKLLGKASAMPGQTKSALSPQAQTNQPAAAPASTVQPQPSLQQVQQEAAVRDRVRSMMLNMTPEDPYAALRASVR